MRDNMDFCTCSSNKCLAGLAGVGIICARRRAVERTIGRKPRVAYLSLHRLYEMFEKYGQTANTPSVTMFIALDAAIEFLLAEGLANRIARHQRCARILRQGLRDLGLETLTGDEVASNTVTSVLLPPQNVPADELIQALEDRKYTIYAGKGPLKEKNMAQVANMGQITEDMCHRFLGGHGREP